MSSESWFFPPWLLGTDTIPSIVWKLGTLSSDVIFPSHTATISTELNTREGLSADFQNFLSSPVLPMLLFLESQLHTQVSANLCPDSPSFAVAKNSPKVVSWAISGPPWVVSCRSRIIILCCLLSVPWASFFHICFVCFVCLFILVGCFSQKKKISPY